MENYCIKNEMDKSYNEEELEMTNYQNQTISQKDIEYTEFLCWILEQKDWENDIMIIKGKDYDRFMESDNNEDEMDMKIIDSDKFYDEFKKISGIDVIRDENNFVSMKYISRNDVNLIVKANGINQRFIIGV